MKNSRLLEKISGNTGIRKIQNKLCPLSHSVSTFIDIPRPPDGEGHPKGASPSSTPHGALHDRMDKILRVLLAEAQELLFPTLWTPDASKPTERIATVEITVYHFLYNGTKVPVLTLKTRFIFQKKTLKIMEKHPVENAALWMTLTIHPCRSTRTLVH